MKHKAKMQRSSSVDQWVEPLRCTVELLLAREHKNCTLKPTMCMELRNWRMLRHRTMCSGPFYSGLHQHDVRPSRYAALTLRLPNTLSTTLARGPTQNGHQFLPRRTAAYVISRVNVDGAPVDSPWTIYSSKPALQWYTPCDICLGPKWNRSSLDIAAVTLSSLC